VTNENTDQRRGEHGGIPARLEAQKFRNSNSKFFEICEIYGNIWI
jgi:hypothetical protein